MLRFCQVTRLQYINSHIILNNRCVLQQQHVDCKITDALLKKGTKKLSVAGGFLTLHPEVDRLFEASLVRDESSVSNDAVTVIPSQHRVTRQILSHWQPFLDLKLIFAGSRRKTALS